MTTSSAQACSLHTTQFSPDRGAVRNTLGSITAEAFEAVCDPELLREIKESVNPEFTIEPYSSYIQQHPERYRRVTTSLPAFINAAGRCTEYVTTTTNTRYDKPIVVNPFVPIGEYGVDPARRLLVGIVRLIAAAEAKDDEIRAIAVKSPTNEHAVLHHTYQGHINRDAEIGLAITMQQGFVSTGQSIMALCMERVPHFDWDQLAREVIDEEKVTEFTRGIGSGLLPFFSIFGRYVAAPLILGSGAPRLSNQLREETRVNRDGFRELVDAAETELPMLAYQIEQARAQGDDDAARELEQTYNARHVTASAGVACPAANRGAEVTRTARLLLSLMPDD